MREKSKVLPPTLREKQRYIVYHTHYFGVPATLLEVKQALTTSVLSFIGEKGFGEAGYQFIKGTAHKGIVRSDRMHVDAIKTSFMHINKINKHNASVSCIGVSGTLAQAEKHYKQ